MVKEKNISPPNEEASNQELALVNPNLELTEKEKKMQKNYEERMQKFIKGFQNLEKKYQIKLLQVPARLIYSDVKYEKDNQ
jgi:ABC-type Zn uptake system ZnuABC Zn-binding protein ZnuA